MIALGSKHVCIWRGPRIFENLQVTDIIIKSVEASTLNTQAAGHGDLSTISMSYSSIGNRFIDSTEAAVACDDDEVDCNTWHQTIIAQWISKPVQRLSQEAKTCWLDGA
jgi:hypothetical protein